MPTLKLKEIPPWLPDERCPCGSGRSYRECCLMPDGQPLVNVPNLLPKPPTTGHANPRCYLSHTNDCSTGKSKEHYISRAVLKSIPGGLIVSGMPRLAGIPQELTANSLHSHILCKRHNECLSPLDNAAAGLFKIVETIYRDLRAMSPNENASWYLTSGGGLSRCPRLFHI
jgi:hypothetical protein